MGRGHTAKVALLFPPLLLASGPAAAEVTERGEGGFVVELGASVPVPPDDAWVALITPARWWAAEHTWSGDSANLTLEPTAGGCFCEALQGAGSVEHMRVIHSAPGRLLRMEGALGPLQGEALAGTLTIEIAREGEGTQIGLTYVVGGHSRFPLVDIATAVDDVLAGQLERLEALLRRDRGTPGEF